MKRQKMFLLMLVRAAMVRPGRILGALAAVIVAATAVTAMLNIYTDVQAKLQHEFRAYGANAVVVAHEGKTLPDGALHRIEEAIGAQGIAAPFAYVIARSAAGEPIVVAGADMKRARQLNHWWQVEPKWPDVKGSVLVGARAAEALAVSPAQNNIANRPKSFELTFQEHKADFTTAGILRTGAAEDSRVYIPLDDFISWTGVGPSTIEVAVSGSSSEVEGTLKRLAAAVPEAEVRPVRQIVEAEGRVLGKTRRTVLTATALIVITSALCMLASLTAWVLDRRKDFAVMKSLGASERLIGTLFAAEAASIGAVGALAGFAAGIGVAAWIGRVNFHATIEPRLSVLPVVLVGSMAVAVLSALVPVSLLRRIQPATMLRGE